MRQTALLICAIVLSSGIPAAAQGHWRELGDVTRVEKLPNGVMLAATAGRIGVTVVNDDSTVRVRAIGSGNFGPDHSWAVVQQAAQNVRVAVNDQRDAVELTTPAGRVRIEKRPLRVVFLDSSRQPILQDDPKRPIVFNGAEFRDWKSSPADEHYYGLGDKAGSFDHRDHAYLMWNTDFYFWQEASDPLYKDIPFFMGLRKGRAWGVFLDNTWRTNFDFGKESRDAFSFGADGGELNYYFFWGPSPKDVVRQYTALTGRTPLPPLFALGYQQSRYSYFPESKVYEIARTLRDHKIPADAIYLDIDYENGYRTFTINRERFPNFEKMIQDLKKQNLQVVTINDLHVKAEPGYAPYDQGHAKDYFVHNPDGSEYVGRVWPGPSVFPDFTRTEVRQWYGTLYRDQVNMGVRGFWNDMNEPAVFFVSGKTMPLDAVHRTDDGAKHPHAEIHNVFGLENVRATYEGVLKLKPDERPFVMTRAAYAGAQRYASSWTGDNTSSWNHMRISVRGVLNLGISGFPFQGVDIGGYAGTPPADLLTRWFELGAFMPIFRDHTEKGSGDQEPWVHGPEHEAIRRRYIELRYRLLPYLYTSIEEMMRTGVPLLRPLFFEFPADELLAGTDDEFFFGPDILVSPQLFEMLDEHSVTLPEGEWYDFWTGTKVKAPAAPLPIGGPPVRNPMRVKIALDQMPIYVRPGAIIPMQPLVQSTAEKPQGPLELRVYPGPNCRGSVYQDDGNSFRYQQGEFFRQSFTCTADAGSLAVKFGKVEGSFAPWWENVAVTIVGVEKQPVSVTAGGSAVPASAQRLDAQQKTFTVTLPKPPVGSEVAVQY